MNTEDGKSETLRKAKQQYQFRDRIIRAVTRDGHFRAVIVKASDVVESARTRHNLNPLAATLLGELLMGSLLASSSLKGDERLSLRLDVSGQVKFIIAEASSHGEVRGYLGNPDLMPESDEPAIMKQQALGTGMLKIVKSLYENSQPVTSIIEMVESSIVRDLTRYYALSEQIPTAIKMDITFNDDHSVRDAVGLMIQTMPGANEQDIIDLEINIIDTPNLGKLVSEGLYIDEILKKVFRNHDLKEVSRAPVDFFCQCTRQKFIDSLSILPKEDLLSLAEKEQEMVCHYCNSRYHSTAEETKALIK